MKRLGNIYQRIISIDNLRLADSKASKGKSWQYGVKVHQRNQVANILTLQDRLASKTYRTSEYTTFMVYEPKERQVFRLPYYPDRITHHAVMNVLEPVFVSVFTADSYSCIKKRGIHAAANAVKRALRDQPGTQYCLKLDIKKFYPSIDHGVLKALLRRKFKDADLLWLLDEIIDSADGLPIGNYLSQYLANFYLTYFDHWLKEEKRVKYYFRYADDLVILSDSKQHLHSLFAELKGYLEEKLLLQVKDNWQIFPVAARGIDFVGYVFYHTHTRLRKGIKKSFARMLSDRPNFQSIASYWGWLKHCNSNHLTKILLHEFIRSIEHQTNIGSLYRRQNQTEKFTGEGNNNTQVCDRAVCLPGKGQWSAAKIATGERQNPLHHVLRQYHTNEHDRAGTKREVPYYHYN